MEKGEEKRERNRGKEKGKEKGREGKGINGEKQRWVRKGDFEGK